MGLYEFEFILNGAPCTWATRQVLLGSKGVTQAMIRT